MRIVTLPGVNRNSIGIRLRHDRRHAVRHAVGRGAVLDLAARSRGLKFLQLAPRIRRERRRLAAAARAAAERDFPQAAEIRQLRDGFPGIALRARLRGSRRGREQRRQRAINQAWRSMLPPRGASLRPYTLAAARGSLENFRGMLENAERGPVARGSMARSRGSRRQRRSRRAHARVARRDRRGAAAPRAHDQHAVAARAHGQPQDHGTQHSAAIDQATLKHVAEEAHHAYFMKRQAEKTAERALEYVADDLLAPASARMYFQRLESATVRALRRASAARARHTSICR